MTDWREVRRQFPAVEASVYLNTAGGGPISRAAAAAGAEYYDLTLRDGDVHWDEWLARVEEVRRRVARFLGVAPATIGFTNNGSAGTNHVAHLLRGQGRVVALRGDFPSVTLPWLQLGYDVAFAEPGAHGEATLDALAAALRPDSRILALGTVHYRTGFNHDLAEIGAFCRERDLLLFVDATQGLGAVPLDLRETPVHFLTCSAYKWLNAGYGVGILYVDPTLMDASTHPAVGWRSAVDPYALVSDELRLVDGAAAIEMGHPPFPGIFSLGEALRLLEETGIDDIGERVRSLSASLVGVLRDAGLRVQTSTDPAHASGIAFAALDGDPAAVRARLADRGVVASIRGGGLRVSTHCYNNDADVEALADALGGPLVG